MLQMMKANQKVVYFRANIKESHNKHKPNKIYDLNGFQNQKDSFYPAQSAREIYKQ